MKKKKKTTELQIELQRVITYLNGECIFPALLGYPLRSRLQQVIQQSQRLDSDTDFGQIFAQACFTFQFS